MQKVISITTDNAVEIKEVNEIDYDLLYESVNGLVEVVSLNRDVDMWLNEEGKLNDLPVNVLATVLWNKVFPNFDVIMGDVIITGGVDEEGNTTGLSDGDILDIMSLIEQGLMQATENNNKTE